MIDFSPLDNPIWNSLNSGHSGMATIHGSAARFASDVSPLVGLRDGSQTSFEDLGNLLPLNMGVGTFTGYAMSVPTSWKTRQSMIDQMVCTELASFSKEGIARLGEADIPDMMALTAATEPGPFQAKTATMGRYFGIRAKDGRLAAMAGQRLKLDGFIEISAVCTDPEFRGHGFARAIVSLLAEQILAAGKTPFLHVKTENEARYVYQKAGFKIRSQMHLTFLQKE